MVTPLKPTQCSCHFNNKNAIVRVSAPRDGGVECGLVASSDCGEDGVSLVLYDSAHFAHLLPLLLLRHGPRNA